MGANAVAVMIETTATGPVANWREDPHNAAIITGINEIYKPK